MKCRLVKYFLPLVLTLVIGKEVYSQDSLNTLDFGPQHGIQLSVSGLFSGSYGIIYERLFKDKHGVIIEGAYTNSNRATGYGIGLGFREHFKKGMNAAFFGGMIKHANFEANTVSDYYNGALVKTYPYNVSLFSIVPNIGKRWFWETGFSIVVRIGYGLAFTNITWLDDKPESSRVDFTESSMKMASGFDGELSIGYCF